MGSRVDETFDDFLQFIPALEAGAVLATLVGMGRSRGPLGRRAIFLAGTSESLGSVTLGGCAEGALRRAAEEVRRSGQSQLLEVNLGSDEAYEFGMTCAGSVGVQLTPLALHSPLWTAAAAARARGEVLRLATVLGQSSATVLLTEDGSLLVESGEITQLRWLAEPLSVTLAQVEGWLRDLPLETEMVEERQGVLLETRLPPAELVIVGAGPIAPPLCRIGRTLGLRITVCDDRAARLTAQRLPDAHALLLSDPSTDLCLPPLSARSHVVIISHDYAHEVPVLRQVLAADVPYAAMVASRRRGQAVLNFLAETGEDVAKLAQVRTPAGLDLGAQTPAGIALSIAAEVTALMHGGTGHFLTK